MLSHLVLLVCHILLHLAHPHLEHIDEVLLTKFRLLASHLYGGTNTFLELKLLYDRDSLSVIHTFT